MRATLALVLALLLLGTVPAVAAQSASMTLSASSGVVVASGSANTTVTVSNPGLQPLSVTLVAVGDVPASFQPSTLTILPSSSESSLATFATSANTSARIHTIAIEARSATGGLVARANYSLAVQPIVLNASLRSEPPRLAPGQNATIDIAVGANVDESVVFSTGTLRPGWSVVFAPATATMGPGRATNTSARLAVPASETPGEYTVPIRARLGTSGNETVLLVEVEVVPHGDGVDAQVFTLKLFPPSLQATPGADATLFLRMWNGGDRTPIAAVDAGANATLGPLLPWAHGSRVTVTAPTTPGLHRTTLTATSAEGGTATAELYVNVTPLAIDLWHMEQGVRAGATQLATVAVNSTASGVVDLRAETTSGEPGWAVEATPAELVVGPGAPQVSSLRIRAPAGATAGHVTIAVHATLRATGETRTMYFGQDVLPGLPPPVDERAPLVEPARIDATVARGENETYHVTIRNPNAGERAYVLEVALPPGWRTSGYPQTVRVQGNATYGHALHLRADADASEGNGTLTVDADGTRVEVPLSLRVAASPPPDGALALSPTSARLSFEAEDETRYVAFEARNRGATGLDYDVTLSVPAGWNASTSTPSGTLAPGANATITVGVRYAGGPDAAVGVKLATAGEAVVAWIDVAPPRPTPPVDTNASLALRLDPAEIVLVAGGSAQARLHASAPAGPLRLVLPVGISADALVLTLAPDADGGWSAAFRVSAGASLLAGPVEGARVEGAGEPLDVPIRVVAAVAPSAPVDTSGRDGAGATLVVAGSAAAVGGAALALAWAHRKWPLAFAALYSRIAPSQVLQHPVRRRMAEAIRAEPGIAVGELQKRLGLSNGVMAHHLHRLEKSGSVASMMDGQWRRLYPAGARPASGGTLAERALRALDGRGAVAATELAAELGVSRQALHYHLKKLAQEGRIRASVSGGVLRVELAPVGLASS